MPALWSAAACRRFGFRPSPCEHRGFSCRDEPKRRQSRRTPHERERCGVVQRAALFAPPIRPLQTLPHRPAPATIDGGRDAPIRRTLGASRAREEDHGLRGVYSRPRGRQGQRRWFPEAHRRRSRACARFRKAQRARRWPGSAQRAARPRFLSWPDWQRYLLGSTAEDFPEAMHRHEATGRPLGARSFVQRLQALPGQTLLPRKRGPKPKAKQGGKRN